MTLVDCPCCRGDGKAWLGGPCSRCAGGGLVAPDPDADVEARERDQAARREAARHGGES